MKLQGAPNARDLGGLPAADGRTIRPGMLLRSGELSRLTQEDLETLQRLNLKTVVDFRTERERAQKPDVVIPGVRYIACPVIQQMTMGITREKGTDPMRSIVQNALACGMRAEEYMAALYPPLVEDAYSVAHYRSFLDMVLHHQEGALLYHCTAGKDRVGVGTLLLLSALGVERQTILEDYLLTNVYIVPDTERMVADAAKYTDDPAAFFAIRAFDGAKTEYLDQIWDSVESRFGSMEAFLAQCLGIGAQERAALREKYLV